MIWNVKFRLENLCRVLSNLSDFDNQNPNKIGLNISAICSTLLLRHICTIADVSIKSDNVSITLQTI